MRSYGSDREPKPAQWLALELLVNKVVQVGRFISAAWRADPHTGAVMESR